MKSQDVRRLVEEAHGQAVPDHIWRWLRDQGYVADVTEGSEPIQKLIAHVEALAPDTNPERPREAAGEFKPQGTSDEDLPRSELEARQLAVSDLLALYAADDPFVVEFRTDVLGGHLMEPEAVEEWIREQARLDGEPTRYLTEIPLAAGTAIRRSQAPGRVFTEPALAIDSDHPIVAGVAVRTLAYGVTADRWARHVVTKAGGPLDRLRIVSGHLAKRFGWWESQASTFTLTGATPIVGVIKTTTSMRAPFSVTSRIVLEVDPAVTADELAERYQRVRKDMLGGGRHRPLSLKHARLAVFAAQRPDDEPPADTMAAWNAAHPDWSYEGKALGNFVRDFNQAQRRLIYPRYH